MRQQPALLLVLHHEWMQLPVVPKMVTYPDHAANAVILAHELVLVDRKGGDLEEPRIGRLRRALDVDNGWRRAVDWRGEHQADGLVRPHDHLPRLGIEALISCMVDQAVALPAPPAREPVGRCPRYGLEGHALLLLGGDHIAPVEIVTEVGNAAHGGYGCVIRFCARRRDYGAILVCTLPHGWA